MYTVHTAHHLCKHKRSENKYEENRFCFLRLFTPFRSDDAIVARVQDVSTIEMCILGS